LERLRIVGMQLSVEHLEGIYWQPQLFDLISNQELHARRRSFWIEDLLDLSVGELFGNRAWRQVEKDDANGLAGLARLHAIAEPKA